MKEDRDYVLNMWQQINKEAKEIVKLGGGNVGFTKVRGMVNVEDPHLRLAREVIAEARKLTNAGYGNIRLVSEGVEK